MTWNIHGCIGADRVFDPARTARVIRGLGPDILALQEVDSRGRGDTGLDIFDYLRELIGDHAVDAKTISTVNGHYGQMLISRWPLRDRQVHDISVYAREPRKVIEAHVDLPGGRLRLLATHLGLHRAERRTQFGAIAEVVASAAVTPALLMGDFNDWNGLGQSRRALSPLFDARTAQRTFPAALPLLPLDRVWCRPARMLVRSWADRSARRASDHLPLVADLRWPEARRHACSARAIARPPSKR